MLPPLDAIRFALAIISQDVLLLKLRGRLSHKRHFINDKLLGGDSDWLQFERISYECKSESPPPLNV